MAVRMCWLMYVLPVISLTGSEDVCNGNDFDARCPSGELLFMEEASFGRMDPGQCLPQDSDNLGCQNDVINLLDLWCSGQPACNFYVPNRDIINANTACSKNFASFLRVTYTCLKDASSDVGSCSRSKPVTLTSASGHLSSHVTDKTGCGSTKSPWVLQAQPGQTIELTLLDFSALDRATSHSLSSCSQVYGFILERALNINHTICGSKERETVIYTSKTNSVEIHVGQKTGATFVLRYSANGCQEPTPPPRAWYKRTGNEAVIGCESNNKQWQLTCSGNTWRGNVGNCSTSAFSTTNEKISSFQFEFSTVVIVAAIIGGTIVLAVGVIVCGTVYLHRYRDEQEKSHTETMTMKPNLQQIDTMRGMTMTHYRPISSANPTSTEEYLLPGSNPLNPDDQLIHTWETALPQPRGEGHGAVTTAGRHNAPMTGAAPGRNSLGNGTGRNDMRPNSGSYYSPNTGHKYYVLDRET